MATIRADSRRAERRHGCASRSSGLEGRVSENKTGPWRTDGVRREVLEIRPIPPVRFALAWVAGRPGRRPLRPSATLREKRRPLSCVSPRGADQRRRR